MIIAHAGHWLVNLMFALPAIAFLGWLGFLAIKARIEGPPDDDVQ